MTIKEYHKFIKNKIKNRKDKIPIEIYRKRFEEIRKVFLWCKVLLEIVRLLFLLIVIK